MPNEHNIHPGIVSLLKRGATLVGAIAIISLVISSQVFAQGNPAFVRQVRAIETGDLGTIHPAGLAYSPETNAFHVVEVQEPVRLPAPFSDIISIRPAGDQVGSVRIWATTADPINVAYDAASNRLLLYHTASDQLLQIDAGTDGHLDPTMLTRHDGRRFDLKSPQGMTVDPARGDLFFLDSIGPRIIRAEPTAGELGDAAITQTDLAPLNLADLHGLAFNPANGHLYTLSRADHTLYELNLAGHVVGTYDVAAFQLADPQGMVFAPSGDLTDDPSSLSLYIADSGLAVGQGAEIAAPAGGQIIELSFARPAAPAAAGFVASLVQTVDTSLFVPPSPDPVGIAYIDASNTLMISDSEVDELAIFAGENLFRVRLSGELFDTLNTLPFSIEPSGIEYNPDNRHLFFSDDDQNGVFEMDPGADGLYDTGDDIITFFSTTAFGSNEPTDIAFARGMGHLYITDWLNSEVYHVTPGGNGVFDGVDDVVTTFDTESIGILHPEGIAFNPDNEHLYIVGLPITAMVETTLDGDLVQVIDISAADPFAPSGLTFAPSSLDPDVTHIYITEWGVDNSVDPNENDGKVYEMTLPPIAGSLSISKEVEPASAGPSELITYTLSFSNDGDDIVTGVTITDIIPVSVTVQSVVSSGVTIADAGAVPPYVWLVQDLAPGEGGFITITAALSSTLPCGHTFDNTAFITATTGDTDPDGNRSDATVAVGRGVVVTPPEADASGDPGTDVVYTLWVTNTGSCADTFDLTVSGNVWAVSIPDTAGPLAPGAGTSADVTVTIPSDARCGADFATVTFTSQSGDSVAASSILTTTANTIYSVTVEPTTNDAFGNPGAVVTHTLWVTNTGTCVDAFDLTVSGDDWPVNAPATVGPLGPGMGARVDATATIPANAQCGDTDTATITLTSQSNGTVDDSSTLTSSANTIYGVIVEPLSDEASADPGTDLVYSLQVSNIGNCADTFNVTVDSAGWPTEAPDTVGPLAPGATTDVDITVTIPPDAVCGDDTAIVTFTSQNSGSVSASSVLTSTAQAVRGIAIEPPSAVGWGNPGADVIHTLWVTNTGNCPDSFDGILTGDQWITEAPDIIGPLEPGLGARVDITVTVPVDAGCGDNDDAIVTFTSQAEGTATDSSDLATWANTVGGAAVDPPSSASWGDPGSDVVYGIWVTNTGNCADVFDVALTGAEWSTEAPDTVGPLAVGVGASVDVTVTVPACTVGGAFDASSVRVLSQNDGTLQESVFLTTTTNHVAPVAVDDSYLALEDTPRTVGAPGVLGNDRDANCEPLSASLTAAPANGIVLLEADGSFTYTPTANFRGDDSFTYTASDAALADTATVTLTVISAGDNPIVNAGEDQTADEGEIVQFNGSFVDPARQILFADETILWEFGDGYTSTGTLIPTHEYRDNGLFTVTLTVTDTEGDAGQDSLLVTVENVAPAVNAGTDQQAVPGKPVSIGGDFSDAGLDDTHSIVWDLGDGTIILDTLALDHTYESVGVYTVTLTVIDDDGGAGSDNAVIGVWYRPYLPLVSRAPAP